MSSFSTTSSPKSLSSFFGEKNVDAPIHTATLLHDDGVKWALDSDKFSQDLEATFEHPPPSTPPRSLTPSSNAASVSLDQKEQDERAQLLFMNSLPSSKHLFFVDRLRAVEHFFQVDFDTKPATTAYFAFNSMTKRLRRVVAQEREALAKSVFTSVASSSLSEKDVEMWRTKLNSHLQAKHYPATTLVMHLGSGRTCTLGELYIHPNRQDLIKDIRETSVKTDLEALDQSLMLDLLSLTEGGDGGDGGSASQQQQQPNMEGKDRTCTIAALILVFNREWSCTNRESVISGFATLDIGALVLHQTRVKSSHLWLSPQISLQSSARETAATDGDSAPDRGIFFESPDMILEAGNSNRQYLEEVVNVSRDSLRKHCA